jgi:hypothetical protein
MLAPPLPPLTASFLEWAHWYARQGWPVIPMHTPTTQGCSCKDGTACTHPGKHPRTAHGRNDASTNPQTIADWWQRWPDANIAIKTDSLFILDVDERHGGKQELYKLEKQYGRLPEGPRVISGSGSDHYYFCLPADGIAVYSSDGLVAPGLDIKGFQGNINMPPSLHTSGKQYLWDALFAPDSFELPPPPDWLVTLARQARPLSQQRYQPGVSIPEGQRYNYLISAAARARYQGYTEDQIYQALQIANQNCQPPEDDKELHAYAKWAARKDMADPHQFNPASLQSTATAPSQNGTTPPSASAAFLWGTPSAFFDVAASMSSEELLKLMLVPPRFLIEQLVPDGLTILGAPAKSYKSFFSLSLALATIGVGDWCDAFPVESYGDVVFFGLEAPYEQLRRRMHQLRPHYAAGQTAYKIHFFSGMKCLPPAQAGLHDAILATIEHYHPRLIVIDPLSYLYRMGRRDDLVTATLDLLWPLAEAAIKHQVAIFAPEHMRKRSKDDVSVIDTLGGSHIKPAVAQAVLMLQRQGEELVLNTTMRDAASQDLSLTLDFDENNLVQWGYKGATTMLANDPNYSELRMKTLAALAACGTSLTIEDMLIAVALPDSRQNKQLIARILDRCIKSKEVGRVSRGNYVWIGGK